MTAEHQPGRPDDERPAPGGIEYGRPRQESMLAVAAVLDRVDDGEVRFRIMDGYLTHGAPFAAYLTLPDVDVTADPDGLVRAFLERCDSSWDTLAGLIDHQLEARGWDDALDDFRIGLGIDEALLDWNQDAWLAILRRSFDLVPLDGRWIVFDKATS